MVKIKEYSFAYEQLKKNTNQEEQLPTPSLDDTRDKPLSNTLGKKPLSNTKLLSGIVVVFGVLVAVGVGAYFLSGSKYFNDYFYFEQKIVINPCGESIDECTSALMTTISINNSGELIIEGSTSVTEGSDAPQEFLLEQGAVSRLSEAIKNSGIFIKNCNEGSDSPDPYYQETYIIAVDGNRKVIEYPYPYCEEELSSIYALIEDEISRAHIDTSAWKIYHNEEYGFQFKYPPNTELEILNEIKGLTVKVVHVFDDGVYPVLVITQFFVGKREAVLPPGLVFSDELGALFKEVSLSDVFSGTLSQNSYEHYYRPICQDEKVGVDNIPAFLSGSDYYVVTADGYDIKISVTDQFYSRHILSTFSLSNETKIEETQCSLSNLIIQESIQPISVVGARPAVTLSSLHFLGLDLVRTSNVAPNLGALFALSAGDKINYRYWTGGDLMPYSGDDVAPLDSKAFTLPPLSESFDHPKDRTILQAYLHGDATIHIIPYFQITDRNILAPFEERFPIEAFKAGEPNIRILLGKDMETMIPIFIINDFPSYVNVKLAEEYKEVYEQRGDSIVLPRGKNYIGVVWTTLSNVKECIESLNTRETGKEEVQVSTWPPNRDIFVPLNFPQDKPIRYVLKCNTPNGDSLSANLEVVSGGIDTSEWSFSRVGFTTGSGDSIFPQFRFKYPPYLYPITYPEIPSQPGILQSATSSREQILDLSQEKLSYVQALNFRKARTSEESAGNYMWTVSDTQYKTIEDWFTDWRQTLQGEVLSTEDIDVDGVHAKKVLLGENSLLWDLYVGMIYKGKLYTFGYGGSLKGDEQATIDRLQKDIALENKEEKIKAQTEEFRSLHREIFETILSTFEFVE